MALTGDFSKLSAVIGELDSVPRLKRPITEAAKLEVWEQWGDQFGEQRDPFGKGWAPTQSGWSPVLDATGALASAVLTAQPNVMKIKLKPEKYWVFHQAGAHGMAERMVLPFQDGSLWDAPIQTRIGEIVMEHFQTAD